MELTVQEQTNSTGTAEVTPRHDEIPPCHSRGTAGPDAERRLQPARMCYGMLYPEAAAPASTTTMPSRPGCCRRISSRRHATMANGRWTRGWSGKSLALSSGR